MPPKAGVRASSRRATRSNNVADNHPAEGGAEATQDGTATSQGDTAMADAPAAPFEANQASITASIPTAPASTSSMQPPAAPPLTKRPSNTRLDSLRRAPSSSLPPAGSGEKKPLKVMPKIIRRSPQERERFEREEQDRMRARAEQERMEQGGRGGGDLGSREGRGRGEVRVRGEGPTRGRGRGFGASVVGASGAFGLGSSGGAGRARQRGTGIPRASISSRFDLANARRESTRSASKQTGKDGAKIKSEKDLSANDIHSLSSSSEDEETALEGKRTDIAFIDLVSLDGSESGEEEEEDEMESDEGPVGAVPRRRRGKEDRKVKLVTASASEAKPVRVVRMPHEERSKRIYTDADIDTHTSARSKRDAALSKPGEKRQNSETNPLVIGSNDEVDEIDDTIDDTTSVVPQSSSNNAHVKPEPPGSNIPAAELMRYDGLPRSSTTTPVPETPIKPPSSPEQSKPTPHRRAKADTLHPRPSSPPESLSPISAREWKEESLDLEKLYKLLVHKSGRDAHNLFDERRAARAQRHLEAREASGEKVGGEMVVEWEKMQGLDGEQGPGRKALLRQDRVTVWQFPPVMPALVDPVKLEEGGDGHDHDDEEEEGVSDRMDIDPAQAQSGAGSAAGKRKATVDDEIPEKEPEPHPPPLPQTSRSFPPGQVGILAVHRSGRTSLTWGLPPSPPLPIPTTNNNANTTEHTSRRKGRKPRPQGFEVKMGAQHSFLQEVVVVERPPPAREEGAGRREREEKVRREAFGMGALAGRMVVVPRW
ncbi:MAG: hypothetical protein M1824_001094 [Vezdaea acicularis]|nr:MAG: hypothetical protein M1824_001094 [Vezdaea acicularis]